MACRALISCCAELLLRQHRLQSKTSAATATRSPGQQQTQVGLMLTKADYREV